MTTPAGWYPIDGGERYWDGNAWTEWARSAEEAAKEAARIAKVDAKAARYGKAEEKLVQARMKAAGLAGLVITDSTIHYNGEGGPIAGARAAVETAGDIDRKITATRLILTGPLSLAWRKKKDHRELYLTVEGTGFAFVIPVSPVQGVTARQVAARINALGSAAAAAQPSAAPAPMATADLAAQIQNIAQMHQSGVLSDEEFTAAKARLLGG